MISLYGYAAVAVALLVVALVGCDSVDVPRSWSAEPPSHRFAEKQEEQMLPEALGRLRSVSESGCLARASASTNYSSGQAQAMAQCLRTHCEAGVSNCYGWTTQWEHGRNGEGSPLA